MNINAIQSVIPNITNSDNVGKSKGQDFKNVLTDFISQVNQNEQTEDSLTKNFVEGGNVEIQDVMIAGEKAKTSLELLMQIRNKALDMYNELTKMQV